MSVSMRSTGRNAQALIDLVGYGWAHGSIYSDDSEETMKIELLTRVDGGTPVAEWKFTKGSLLYGFQCSFESGGVRCANRTDGTLCEEHRR